MPNCAKNLTDLPRTLLMLMASTVIVAAQTMSSMNKTTSQLAAAQELTFCSTLDGAVEKYIQRLPPGFDARQPHDVLIALHGHGADRQQFATDDRDESRGKRDRDWGQGLELESMCANQISHQPALSSLIQTCPK